jgi:hypothetical protein
MPARSTLVAVIAVNQQQIAGIVVSDSGTDFSL